jgi:phosphatidylserine decarboxylase
MKRRALYEGRWIFAILLILWVVCFLLIPWLALLPALAILFTLWFFRDPHREVPSDPTVIVSPADGVVTDVEQVAERPFGSGPGWRISIFLSIFDVHVNRSPVAGTVIHSEFKPGEFLDARNAEAQVKNQSRTWQIREDSSNRLIEVRQIAGAIARRIVAWSQPGDPLERGERFGMIRFGSRTDLFLPSEAEVLVKPGDRVAGASSPIARWKSSSGKSSSENIA